MKNSKTTIFIVVITILLAITFFMVLKFNTSQDIEGLENTGQSTEEERSNIEVSTVENNALRVVTPNGGESYCLGAPIQIKWEVSSEIQVVNLRAKRGGTETNIGDAVAINTTTTNGVGIGSFEWDGTNISGDYLSEAETYFIRVFGRDKNNNIIEDTSDGPFALVSCG